MIEKLSEVEELANSLLESIRGEGESVALSPEDIEKDRRYYLAFFEESTRKERMRSAKARNVASEIYLD